MKLVIDENIASAKQAFNQFGEMLLTNGRNICNDILRDADVLIVRSITNVNENLLANTNVKFVGTATIGTEHIDTDYLNKKEIVFASSKGCNADSVAEYVFTSLIKIASERNLSLKDETIGVIGVGNIGSKVVNIAQALGLKVLKNDPPKERAGFGTDYVSLEEALQANIITLHVPLNRTGIDKTIHLLDSKRLNKIKANVILINSSRGAVVDNTALLNSISDRKLNVVLDVWEDEPFINSGLLQKVILSTPHIAGYSLEGKTNGTKMIYDALCKFTANPKEWQPVFPPIEHSEIELPAGKSVEQKLHFVFKQIYNIANDDALLRGILKIDEKEMGAFFDKLRKEYPVRREFNNYTILIREADKHLTDLLKSFRFKIAVKN